MAMVEDAFAQATDLALTVDEAAERPRLVLCEHSEAQRSIMRKMIASAGFDVSATSSAFEALGMAERGEVDVVIANVEIQDMSGQELCWSIKSLNLDSDVYVIIASSDRSADHHAASLDAGADDMIRKPFEQSELLARLRVARRTLALTKRLRTLASSDPLTGLSNRRSFERRLTSEISASLTNDLPLSLVLCDADKFKSINDEHGHAAGDACLVRIAEALAGFGRGNGLVARLGGEEFAILAPMDGLDAAGRLAERARRSLETSPVIYRGAEIPLTASFGVAEVRQIGARAGAAPEAIAHAFVETADNASYRAKQAGRNRVCIAEGQDLRSVMTH